MSTSLMLVLLLTVSCAQAITGAQIPLVRGDLTWEMAANKSGHQHNAVLSFLQSQGPVPQDGLWTRDAFERMLSSGAAYAVAELGTDRALTTKILEATKDVMINEDTTIVKKDRTRKTTELVRYEDLNDLIDLLDRVKVNDVAGRRLRSLRQRLIALGDSASEDDVNGLVEAFVNAGWSPSEKQYVAFFSNVFEASSRYWDKVEAEDVSVSVRKPKGKWRKRLADAIGAFVGGLIGGAIGGPAGAGTGAAIGGAVASHLASR